MKYSMAISIIVVSMLTLELMPGNAGNGKGGGGAVPDARQADHDQTYQRDRTQGRTRLETLDQDRDRTYMQDPSSVRNQDVYGIALMTEDELNQYRKQRSKANTQQAREQYELQHEEKMWERAQKQSRDLVPPGQGVIYGGELMTVQERNQYREQLRRMDSEEERQKYKAQHRDKLNRRAEALSLEVEEAE